MTTGTSTAAGEKLPEVAAPAARGRARVAIRAGIAESSLGLVLVGLTDRGVCAILLGDDPGELMQQLTKRFPGAEVIASDGEIQSSVDEVLALVESPADPREIPLDPIGTAFQRRVWAALAGIPPGSTATYSEVARRIGTPTGPRAVARACAANPLAVVIPCHRVVRSDGTLGGYSAGLERKRALLAREVGS